jgi:hypothetical protein
MPQKRFSMRWKFGQEDMEWSAGRHGRKKWYWDLIAGWLFMAGWWLIEAHELWGVNITAWAKIVINIEEGP